MSSVTFSSVTKRFGDVVAVDALDLAIDDGEFMVLLGPSGCGKTTALRIVAGLERSDAGQLHIGERNVTQVEAKDRDSVRTTRRVPAAWTSALPTSRAWCRATAPRWVALPGTC